MESRKDKLKLGRYARWRNSLLHNVVDSGLTGTIIKTACGLTRNVHVHDITFTDTFPAPGNHCWNCRVAMGDVKPQIPTEVKVVKP